MEWGDKGSLGDSPKVQAVLTQCVHKAKSYNRRREEPHRWSVVPNRCQRPKAVERSPAPIAMEGLSPDDVPLRVATQAVILPAQSVNQLLPNRADRHSRRLRLPLKNTVATSPPNKPNSKAAQKLPANITLRRPHGAVENSGERKRRGWPLTK